MQINYLITREQIGKVKLLAEFVTWNDIQYFVWFFSVIIPLGLILRMKWKHSEKMSKKITNSKMTNNTDEAIDKLVNDAPKTLELLRIEIKNLEEKGSTPDQLKSLKEKEKMLQYAVTYGEIGKEFVKPLVKAVTNVFKNWGG